MKLATRCPSCNTAFRVAPERLIPTRGQVRCGVCQHVFNAYDFLVTITAVSPDAATLMAAQPTITANERQESNLPKNTVIPPDRPLTSQQKELLALIDAAQAQQDEADRLAKQGKEKVTAEVPSALKNQVAVEADSSLNTEKTQDTKASSAISTTPPESSVKTSAGDTKLADTFSQSLEINIAQDIAKSLSHVAMPDIAVASSVIEEVPIAVKTVEPIPVIPLRSELDAELERHATQSETPTDLNVLSPLKTANKEDKTTNSNVDTAVKKAQKSDVPKIKSTEVDSQELSALLNTISDDAQETLNDSKASLNDSPVLTLPTELLNSSSANILSAPVSLANDDKRDTATELPRLTVDSPILADSPLAAIKQLSGSDVPIKPLDTSDEALKKALERTKKRTARKLAAAKAEKAKRAAEQEKLGLKPGLVDEITRLLEDDPHDDDAKQTGLEHLVLPEPAEPPDFVKVSLAKQRKKRMLLITGVAVASVMLMAQFLYTWRDDIAARRESLRPSMELFCKLFFCQVRAPHHIDEWEIIGHKVKIPFDAKTQQAMTDVYAFEVTLKNKSRTPLALPHLEFSLFDDKNQLISRRVVNPDDYLKLSGRSNEEVAQILKYGWREEEYTANLWIRVKGGSFTNYKVGHFYP